MSNTTVNLEIEPVGPRFREINTPVDGGSHIYRGSLVSQLTATGMLVPGSTASSGPACGVAGHEMNNTGSDADERCMIQTDGIFIFANATDTDACSEATALFSVVYMYDDHTIADNSASSTRQPAGLFMGMEEDGRVRVYVGWRLAAMVDAAAISIADAGLFTTAADVEAALQELYQDALSTQAFIPIPIMSWTDNGAPLIAFADGTANGTALVDSEAFGFRFNPVGQDTSVLVTSVPMPPDLDDAADIVLHVACFRVGASDVTTVLTGAAFFQTVGAAHTADADAITVDSAAIDAATTVVEEVTLTIAAADVPASPSVLTLTLAPSAALDADDLVIVGTWLEYTRKLLTA